VRVLSANDRRRRDVRENQISSVFEVLIYVAQSSWPSSPNHDRLNACAQSSDQDDDDDSNDQSVTKTDK